MSYSRFTIRKYTEEMDNMMLLSNQGKRKKSHNIVVSDTLVNIRWKMYFISKLNTYICVWERERQRGKISAKQKSLKIIKKFLRNLSVTRIGLVLEVEGWFQCSPFHIFPFLLD